MSTSDWIALGELIVAIIGIIIGCIGGKELKEANKVKVKFRDIETKIEKLEISSSQIAHIINNNGIGVKDAEYVAEKIVEEKTKNKPNVFVSKEKPTNLQEGDIWFRVEDEENE